MACPTKSLTKYIQQVGRGSRTLSNTISGLEEATADERRLAIKNSAKPKCVILDIVDVSSRHKLVNTFELDKDKPAEEKVFATQDTKDKLIAAREERKKQIYIDRSLKHDKRVDLLELPKVKLSTSWRGKDMATEKQLGYLQRLGFDTQETTYTIQQAIELISYAPATDAQISALSKWKYDVSAGVTRGQAEKAFDAIKDRLEKQKMEKEMKNNSNNNLFTDVF